MPQQRRRAGEAGFLSFPGVEDGVDDGLVRRAGLTGVMVTVNQRTLDAAGDEPEDDEIGGKELDDAVAAEGRQRSMVP